jgi:hypothetical protein
VRKPEAVKANSKVSPSLSASNLSASSKSSKASKTSPQASHESWKKIIKAVAQTMGYSTADVQDDMGQLNFTDTEWISRALRIGRGNNAPEDMRREVEDGENDPEPILTSREGLDPLEAAMELYPVTPV